MSALALLVLLAASPQGLSAGSPPQEPPKQATDTRPVPQSTDYQVGPGDVLSIRVSGVREFDQTTRVSNSGRIRVPYVGIMFVAGMSALQIERDVTRLIKEHELVTEPLVRVNIEQYRSRPTYVIGEVNAPGQFMITTEMYVLDLISKAGGVLSSAEGTALLYRRNSLMPSVETKIIGTVDRPAGVATLSTGPTIVPKLNSRPPNQSAEDVISINLKELREGTRPESNIRLEGGDILFIPRRRMENFYIIGDVKAPGAYIVPRSGKLTAAQAIIYSGGPLPTAKMGSGFLMRHDEKGVRQAIPVNFTKIIEGKAPDIPVKPDDIIFIPSSAAKTLALALFNGLPQFLQQFLIF